MIKNLEDAEKYIKKEYKHLSTKAFKKIYVYGITGKTAVIKAKDKGIETFELKEILVRYMKILDDYLANMNVGRKDIPKGKRYYLIGELEGLDKFISFLLNNNFFNDSKINKLLKDLKINELSKLK